ncbi:uncharacterized protein LOC115627561 [Scaptodrosophila lebanonensis]|uniref:Uncharacterized protein LOC115627561 n=1 Tax=Drosophila lebanonensis TaxID=7225 RepID=A0A6J2TW69_DROLE|nr:uncharacterized protein LOC115627561 [Scaptodrosophila lebanonensis]
MHQSEVCTLLVISTLIITLLVLPRPAATLPAVDVDSSVDFDYYSNEYDDVRPNLVYPDVPRLDKRISHAFEELGEHMKQAWTSMVNSFDGLFEELKGLFSQNPAAHY